MDEVFGHLGQLMVDVSQPWKVFRPTRLGGSSRVGLRESSTGELRLLLEQRGSLLTKVREQVVGTRAPHL